MSMTYDHMRVGEDVATAIFFPSRRELHPFACHTHVPRSPQRYSRRRRVPKLLRVFGSCLSSIVSNVLQKSPLQCY